MIVTTRNEHWQAALRSSALEAGRADMIMHCIDRAFNGGALDIKDIALSSKGALNPQSPGLIIFSSGTTGPPKGVLLRRMFFFETALELATLYGLTEADSMVHGLPVHHLTGFGVALLPMLAVGAHIEFDRNSHFDAGKTWDRWFQGGLTVFAGVPTMYVRLMQYFEKAVKDFPGSRERFVAAAHKFRIMSSGSAALPQILQGKWTALRGGTPVLERYGSTEIGLCFAMSPGDTFTPDVM